MRARLLLLPAVMTLLYLGARPVEPGGASSGAPARVTDAWVGIRTDVRLWVIRVEGGPAELLPPPRLRPPVPWRPRLEPRDGEPLGDPPVEVGGRLVYTQVTPKEHWKGKTHPETLSRLMVADMDGSDRKVLFTGLSSRTMFFPTPDRKAVICAAVRGDHWDLYRVPVDGSPPSRITRRNCIDCPPFRQLRDGRLLYLATNDYYSERSGYWTSWMRRGPVVLTDRQTERVIFDDHIGDLPDITPDGTKAARAVYDRTNGGSIEVKDVRTGRVERFPVTVFNPDWRCQMRHPRLRPDGKAVAVVFAIGSGVLMRGKEPLPGDEIVQNFGVIWLDGRKDAVRLFRVDEPSEARQPASPGRPGPGWFYTRVEDVWWSTGPEA